MEHFLNNFQMAMLSTEDECENFDFTEDDEKTAEVSSPVERFVILQEEKRWKI